MWDLPGLEIEPVSPALAGRFLTTVLPGKSCLTTFSLAPLPAFCCSLTTKLLQGLFFVFFKFYFILLFLFIYLFLVVLHLHCCVRAFSSCGEQGLLFVAVRGFLIAVASLVAEHGL